MAVSERVAIGSSGPFVTLGGSHGARRFFRWSGSTPSASTPTAGADVDGVAGFDDASTGSGQSGYGFCALPGWPIKVEAGGAFSSGADLATDGLGRAVAAGAGDVVVARAIEGAGGAGEVVWATFASGR